MLYATTRSKTDTYTAHRTLFEDRAPDGGFFVPFRMPNVDIQSLKENSFSEAVAEILNVFFSTGITAWDVDCCIGKSAARIISMPHRVLLAHFWNNPDGDYGYICRRLHEKLCGEIAASVTDWANVAIRISVLFGIYTILHKMGIDQFDLTVNTGDFSIPVAAWYARKMGLPIGTIICACNDNSAAWDFIHRGELNTAMCTVKTVTPELDVANPFGVERLIYESFGLEEAGKYVEASCRNRIYQIRPDMTQNIGQGMFVSVVGKDRIEAVMNSVYRSNDCILDPYTAVSYGSLQDYRAKTGESWPTVLLWDRSPVRDMSLVQKATGLTKIEIEKLINHI